MEGKITVMAGVFFVLCLIGATAFAQENKAEFSRSAFYSVMQSGTLKEVDSEILIVHSISFLGEDAFLGTLLMKKAGLVSGPEKKLSLFKSGHKKLDSAILLDSLNTEFRFMRLMIQEHAPGILGYKGDLTKDKDYIRKTFRTLPDVVQQAVLTYSKKSGILKPEDF
jgi:hypothetical protein